MSKDIPLRTHGVTVLVFHGQRTLLLKRMGTPLAGTWAFIAGKNRKNESSWKAGLRELEEETGIHPDHFCSPGIVEQYYEPDSNALWLRPVFVALCLSEPVVRLNHEHASYAWHNHAKSLKALPCTSQRKVLSSAWELVLEGSLLRIPNLI